MLSVQSRRTGLVIEEVGADLLIYDEERDVAHSLTDLASAVFALADGRRDDRALARAVGERLERPVDEDEVAAAVAELEDHDLLVAPAPGVSRRDMVKRVAVAGAAGALGTTLIRTAVAPTAAMADSCTATLTQGQGCTMTCQCTTGCC